LTGHPDAEPTEFEIAGELIDGMNVSAGYTRVSIEDRAGNEARPYVPPKLVKLSATYTVPGLPALKVGGVLKWQDDVYTTHGETGTRIDQAAYSTLDLVLRYDANENLTAALNIRNVTDKKYLNSIFWDQAYYGAPRNAQASVTWRY
jgi:outer membrane receptor for ferric coprogen and ferric-rhodotorulic acid